MLPDLDTELECERFKLRLYSSVKAARHIERVLGDETVQLTANDLNWMWFNTNILWMRDFITDPAKVAAFKEIYPQEVHLLDAGADVADSFERLHTVHQAVRANHSDRSGRVLRDRLEAVDLWTVEDRGALRGLSKAQQEAYESQMDPHGFLYLTKQERETLRTAIEAELGGPDKKGKRLQRGQTRF